MPKSIYSTDQESLRRELRALREKAGVTQVQLARKLAKPQSFVSKYESGERRLDLLEVRTICRVLGTSLASFIQHLERLLR